MAASENWKKETSSLSELLYRERVNMNTEDKQREQMCELQKRLESDRKACWNECQHVAGCNLLSDQSDLGSRTSILWHKQRDETWFGICTVCQRHFVPNDPDYKFWRSKKSYSLPSASDDGKWKPITEEVYKEGSKDQIRVGDDLEW